MLTDNYLDFLYTCFNQYVYQTAKDNIIDIQHFFDTFPPTVGNKLVENLIAAIKTYDFESIGVPLFRGIMIKSGKSEGESEKIMSDIINCKNYSKEQTEPVRKLIKDICADNALQKAGKLYVDHPSDYINYIKSLDIKTSEKEVELIGTGFSSLDFNTMIAEGDNRSIPSKFDFINQTFKPEMGYPATGLNLICMPPGTGKTLFAMQEALNMALSGYKVHYLCMGDMIELDFITRMGAMYLGKQFYEVKLDLKNTYSTLKGVIRDNLEITVVPANEITVDEYVDFIRKKGCYQICFIDYDSQFKSKVFTDSMYLVYGEIYSKLSELTVQDKKLVFILAQPMKASWQIQQSLATINIDMVGESSRKIHAVDWAMTRSREINDLNGLGIFKIVKSRRGEENVIAYSIRLGNGRFKILPRGVYEQIKNITEKREFTEQDIDGMIASYQGASRVAHGIVQNKMNNQQQQGVGGGWMPAPGPSPFV